MLTYFKKNKTANTLSELARILRVKITRTTLDDTLIKHPDFPSLLSVSDTLRRFGVSNLAVKSSQLVLEDIPLPYITRHATEAHMILVTSVTRDAVGYYDGDRYRKVPRSAFVLKENAFALLLTVEKGAGEKAYRENRSRERKKDILPLGLGALCVVIAVFACIIQYAGNSPLYAKGWFGWAILLKSAGLAITALLLWYEIDKNNAAVKKLCGAKSDNGNEDKIRKVSCSAVLDSPYARFLGLSWSEIGFYYFSFGFLSLILSGQQSGPFLQLLAILNGLAVPYIVYSLVFQGFIIKRWCALCMGVQATLLIELLVNMNHFPVNAFQLPAYTYIPGILLMAALPVMGWNFFKDAFKKSMDRLAENRKLKKVKFNEEAFKTTLLQQKQQTEWPAEFGVNLGNADAPNTLLKVCNPDCKPCADSHEVLMDLVSQHPNLQVKIVYNLGDATDDPARDLVNYFLTVNKDSGTEGTVKVLNRWYQNKHKDYGLFFMHKNRLDYMNMKNHMNISAMGRWCIANGVTHTPTFFFNGHQLPDEYELKDLSYFLYE